MDMLIHGWWTIKGFPKRVSVLGRSFRRTRFAHPYKNVIHQYREEVPFYSMHLMVYKDGHWAITHADVFNPDTGNRIKHFIADVLHLKRKPIKNAS